MRTICVLLLVATLCGANEIVMKNGTVIEGTIVESTHEGIKAKVEMKDGAQVVAFKAENLDPHFFYAHRKNKVGKDAAERLRLAVYAFENGMFNRSRHQYNQALVLDAKLVQKFEKEIIPKIKEDLAANLLANAKEMIKKDDLQAAERSCAKLLSELWDTKSADGARQVLDTCLAKIEKRGVTDREKLAEKAEREAKVEQAKHLRKMQALIGPIEKKIESARRLHHNGLKNHHLGQAKGQFASAAKKFTSAVKDCDGLEKKTDDAIILAKGESLRAMAVDEAIESYISQGSVYLTRRAYNDALVSANNALALDPKSSEAKQFRARVETAAQYRSGWGRGGR